MKDLVIEEKDKRLKEKDKRLNEKDDLIEAKSHIISDLQVKLLKIQGALHCRGLLESLLILVHCEKRLSGNFNAARTCCTITDAEKGTIEHNILFEAGMITLQNYLCISCIHFNWSITSASRCAGFWNRWGTSSDRCLVS